MLYCFLHRATLAITQSVKMLNDSSLFGIEDDDGVAYALANVFDGGEDGSNKNTGILYAESEKYNAITHASQLQMALIYFVSPAISNAAPVVTAPTMRMS